MIKYNELKVGDLVMAQYDGQLHEGEVRNLNGDEKQVCVATEVQEFWYELGDLQPITLDEAQLFKLGFEKQVNDDGSIKYSKGAFRMLLRTPDNFSDFEIWYREDRRHITQPIKVHTFQNHYLEMTKIHLTKA